MRILRHGSLSEMQVLGCVSAFSDSLNGCLEGAMVQLRRLEGQPKGAAFAFEMQMDVQRYGALIVLERWAELVHACAGKVRLSRHPGILDEAPARVLTAENLLGRTNRLIDAAEQYPSELVAACGIAFDAVREAFREELEVTDEVRALETMQSKEFIEARRVFLADLAAR